MAIINILLKKKWKTLNLPTIIATIGTKEVTFAVMESYICKGVTFSELINTTGFKCNKKLNELIDSNVIKNSKVKNTNTKKEGKCIPCLVNNRALCSKQLLTNRPTNPTNKSYIIFEKVNFSNIYGTKYPRVD